MSKKWKTKKSFRSKLENNKDLPKIVPIPEKWQKRFGKGTMLIPKPLDINALVRKIKRGELATISLIREKLANDYKTNVTCPLTTGIFLKIVAYAAEEDREKGIKNITPYWRVLRDGGYLIDKFPGGFQSQADKLIEEGHEIEYSKGKKPPKVKNYVNCLTSFK
ncbi:MAG: hypothetical protein ACTSYQ_04660 [Candidatus Odinarchaeia archaeon]